MKLMKTVTVLAAATVLTVVGVGTQSVNADSISDTQSALTTKKSESSILQQQLQATEAAVTKLNAQGEQKALAIQKSQADIQSATDKIADFDKQITVAQKEVKARTTTMQKQLRSLQKEVGNSVTGNIYFDFILNADNVSDAVGRSFTVNKLNQANQEALADVQEASAKLSDLKQAASDNKATLVAAKAKLVAEQDQLKTLSVQASAKQAALQQKITENQAAVNALQGDLTKATAKAKAAAAKAQAQAAKKATVVATAAPKATIQKATAPATASKAAPVATYTGSGSMSGIVGVASGYLGVPYVYGGSTPSGFDCSGLVAYSAARLGISLPRTSQAQSTLGQSVSMSALQPGDLLFWGGVGSAYHVAIYVGGGSYIHAPKPGDVVKIQSMQYFAPSFAKRL